MINRLYRPREDIAPRGGPRRRALLGGALALGTMGLWLPVRNAMGATPLATVDVSKCATWGARPSSRPVTVLGHRPDKVIVHHTATLNSTDYSQRHAFALARSIQRYHMENNGWIDSGQHFTISRGGHVLEGRHRSLEALHGGASIVRGGHCPGQNTTGIGIENEGTYTAVGPPQALYAELVKICAYLCDRYELAPDRIYGHRDFSTTRCPGDVLYGLLPRLREDVAELVGRVSTKQS